MSDNKEARKGFYPCRACGLDQGYDMWKPMSYSICPCCNSIEDLTNQLKNIPFEWW